MKLVTTAFADRGAIPPSSRSASRIRKRTSTLSDNRNPDFAWSGAAVGDAVVRVLCASIRTCRRAATTSTRKAAPCRRRLPRVDFSHWVLVDLRRRRVADRARRISLERRDDARQARAGGAARARARASTTTPAGSQPTRDMAGDYYGYDGPCPPWNDEIPHRYVFTRVRARRRPRSRLDGRFARSTQARARWRATCSRRRR